jgi:hypothetical protein
MELKGFLAELIAGLSLLDFVLSMDVRTEAFTVKGRIDLREQGFLETYFNEKTQTLAIAWIADGQRKWGIDRANLRGWHWHPLQNPDERQAMPAANLRDNLMEFAEVWRQPQSSARDV